MLSILEINGRSLILKLVQDIMLTMAQHNSLVGHHENSTILRISLYPMILFNTGTQYDTYKIIPTQWHTIHHPNNYLKSKTTPSPSFPCPLYYINPTSFPNLFQQPQTDICCRVIPIYGFFLKVGGPS